MRRVKCLHITLANVLSVILLTCVHLVSTALPTEYYSSHSRLATGHWIKIRVKNRGIHQISFETLRQLGFKIPENVNVYGYGGVLASVESFSENIPDDVAPQMSVQYDQKLIFYGEPGRRTDIKSATEINLTQNRDSDYGYYFLSDISSDSHATPVAYNHNATDDSFFHWSNTLIRPELENSVNGGAVFYGENMAKTSRNSYSLPVKNIIPASIIEISGILAIGGNAAKAKIEVENKSVIVSKRDESTDFSVHKFNITTDAETAVRNSNATVEFSDAGSELLTLMSIDYLNATYRRSNSLNEDAQIIMSFSDVDSGTRCHITDAPEHTMVWHIPSGAKVIPFETDRIDNDIVFTPDRPYSGNDCCHTIAFNPEAQLHEPEIIGKTDNSDLHSLPSPHMLIIASPLCMNEARRLAEIHRRLQGIDVIVTSPEAVYNEFSSGTPSSIAYRRFAKMFYDREPEKFRYLLFFGGGSFDNRQKLPHSRSFGNDRLLLTYPVRDYNCQTYDSGRYTADIMFGMLDDEFNAENINSTRQIPSIAVGRIPAIDTATAKSYVDKVECYFSSFYNHAMASTNVLAIGDDGDRDSHIAQAEEISKLITSSSPETTVKKIYNPFYPWTDNVAKEAKRAIKETLADGTTYMFYIGHGRTDSFTMENIWNTTDVKNTRHNVCPFALLATCDAFTFDRLITNIGETMLYEPNGGAIAIIGASRTVYWNANHQLHKAFANALFNTTGSTYGEVYLDCLKKLLDTRSAALRINTFCYNFGGDPALPIIRKSGDIELTVPEKLSIPESNTFTGQILDRNGNIDTEFNGNVSITVFESPDSATNLYQIKSGKIPLDERIVKKIETDERQLYRTVGKITGGQFKIDIVMPQPARTSGLCRIVATATDSNRKLFASGTTKVGISLTDMPYTDTIAPEIELFTIDSENFIDGDIVDETISVKAVVSDNGGSGIGMTHGGTLKGNAPWLTLDDTKNFYTSPDNISIIDDRSVELNFNIKDLTDGPHSLTLHVADNSGNQSEAVSRFTVINRPEASLMTDEKIARQSASIELIHDFRSAPSTKIVIETIDRKPVFTCENTNFPFVWNLKDNTGKTVADGIYNIRAFLKAGNRHCATRPLKITVLKPITNDQTNQQ